MKIYTLSIGDKYKKQAEILSKTLPLDIKIYDNLPKNAILFYENIKKQKIFNTNCKRFMIKDSEHLEVLCIDSDAICTSRNKFLECYKKLDNLDFGIYSPYTFSAYGFHIPKIKDINIDKNKLMYNVKFFLSLTKFSEKDLLSLYMPYEWFCLFKFKNQNQKKNFIENWDKLEKFAIENKNIHLRNESYLISISAKFCNLKINKINYETGLVHKPVKFI